MARWCEQHAQPGADARRHGPCTPLWGAGPCRPPKHTNAWAGGRPGRLALPGVCRADTPSCAPFLQQLLIGTAKCGSRAPARRRPWPSWRSPPSPSPLPLSRCPFVSSTLLLSLPPWWHTNPSPSLPPLVARELPQVHGHDFSCAAFLPAAPGAAPGRYLYASGSEEKVVRVFEAPQAFRDTLAMARGEAVGPHADSRWVGWAAACGGRGGGAGATWRAWHWQQAPLG